MNLGLKNLMSVNVTVVSNEFIDTYMAKANGEYVKVFLYLLRHENEDLTVSVIADALNHTEADVKRALAYWKDAGVLADEAVSAEQGSLGGYASGAAAGDRGGAGSGTTAGERSGAWLGNTAAAESVATVQMIGSGSAVPVESQGSPLAEIPEQGNSFERMQKLAEDVEFSALLYAVQQYLGKTFTQIECEKFAYFYDGLNMSGELLEYLAEYCASGGHTSIRYIEKVALNWYQMGI